ncbi:MAG TPA: hypothetical protein DEV93_15675 [Chloroflexi bacterium]|nr:hypothetical protein [Chloroflexota bacterium]
MKFMPGTAALFGMAVMGCSGSKAPISTGPTLSLGAARVSHIPGGRGLQYCVRVSPAVLAPAGSHNVFVNSISAYVSTTEKNLPALVAITGRYPTWGVDGTTVYQQPFTGSNAVDLEITYEFPPSGYDCIEVFGKKLVPAGVRSLENRMLVGFSYVHGNDRRRAVKLFAVAWGPYLKQFGAPVNVPSATPLPSESG